MEYILSPSLPIKLIPEKTVFITGAGISVDPPASLPIGNPLTKLYLEHALGGYFDSFTDFWTEHFPGLEHFVHDGTWGDIDYRSGWKVYPRLEFVIGEIDKLDKCFANMKFTSPTLQHKYYRGSSISALRKFSMVSPNQCHYWLAEYAKAGSVIVTANFDTGIENAMGVDATITGTQGGIKIVNGIYHFHGVATDKDIATNLGATIKNISKGFPQEFKNKLIERFENGWDLVFLGYGGVDYFDMMPFFKEMSKRKFTGRAIYVKHCWDDDSTNSAMKESPKPYQYLLDPFENQYIVYGNTLEFMRIASDFSLPIVKLASDNDVVNETKKELFKLSDGNETYHFINLVRFCSQLTISPGHFEKDYVKKIKGILDEWEDDGDLKQKVEAAFAFTADIVDHPWESKELMKSGVLERIGKRLKLKLGENELSGCLSLLSRPVEYKVLEQYVNRTCEILEYQSDDVDYIEQNTVFYFSGYRLKKDMICWIVLRKTMRKRFEAYKILLDRLLTYAPTQFTYRTYYLSLCRVRDAYEAMMSVDDGNPDSLTYGDIDFEWFTCMQIPDIMDAERITRNRIFQYWIRLLRGRRIKIEKWRKMRQARRKLLWMRTDPPHLV